MSENTFERNGKSYKIIDPDTYIDECKWNEIVEAEKSGYIIAREAKEGERVDVMTQNGNHEASETAKKGDWIVTRADEDGNPILDENGNRNSWIVSDDVIEAKYEKRGYANREELFFKPLGETQEFMRVQEDVAVMVPWGENGEDIPLTVDKGGYLNITDRDDVHGIAENEFNDTYRVTYHKRSEVDRDIYEAGRNGNMRDANVNAIIEKLAEHGIKASIDHDANVKEINIFRRSDLESINSDRDDSWLSDHDTTVLKAELPNGMNIKIITDEIPDRAAVAECRVPVSEAYHHEDAPKDRTYSKEYRPDVDYRITHIQGSISDVAEKIAEAGHAKEISYGELIKASAEKYFPEKADKVADSLLVRSDLTADEKEMLASGDRGYYSPNKTIIMPEGETMDKDDTEGLVKEVEECEKLKEALRSTLEHGDAELEKITEADPQTQEERVSTVKDCQKFLDTALKNPIKGREHEYGEGFGGDYAHYYELDCNKAVLATALSSDSLDSYHMIAEATAKYKDELLDESEKDYSNAIDEERLSDLEAQYGEDYVDDERGYASEEYEERNHWIDEMAVAPASYIVQNHYASAIESVSDIQKDISKDLIDQLSADTQGVTHDDVSKNFSSYEISGLDSAQLLENADGNRALQVTYSKGRCFNAIKVDIPVEEFDDPASAVSAAAKYSQTKEEFEKEMPNLTYDETYAGEDMSYVEEAESLGEVEYDDEIDLDEANEILGIEDEPEEEHEERTGENRHQEYDYDDQEYDDYDEFEL